MLNPDAMIIEEQTIVRLIYDLEIDSSVGIVGPALTEGNERQPWDHGELTGWKARVAGLAGGSHYRRRDTKGNVDWVSGAAFIIRTGAYRNLNGFDEQFFLFKEEEDLCLRLRHAGLKVLYDPSITIAHDGGGSGASKDEHMARSVAYFNEKHLGVQTAR